jgi:hypothetical protein
MVVTVCCRANALDGCICPKSGIISRSSQLSGRPLHFTRDAWIPSLELA